LPQLTDWTPAFAGVTRISAIGQQP